jgi:phage terminase Nu1 subunit (DNA packaging protein)
MIKTVNGIDFEMTADEIAEFEISRVVQVAPPTVTDYTAAITAMMDGKAREQRYDSAVSISTYTSSTNPVWQAEAQAFVDWRDAVWTYSYAELDKVLAGSRAQPTIDEFLTELPPLVWPSAA